MNNSTIIPNSHMTQQIAANPAAAMSSYAANNIPLLPNHQTPQQSFIPGHLPQHVAPHPQHQAAFAATALNQQQAGAPSSFVNFSTILNQKDSRWLQLEVCREFQRNKCSRPDVECKFAHPGSAIEIQSGKVTACYDSIKGRCNRDKPPCKYFHPPQHLKDQLLINGRNHLALKNALMQQVSLTTPALLPSHHTSPMVLGTPLPPAAVCGYSYPIGYLGNAATSGIPFGYSCDQSSAANVLGIISDNYGAGVPTNGVGGPGHNNAAAAAAAAAATAAAMRLGGANMNNPIRQAQQAQQTAAAIHQASNLWNQNGIHTARPRSDRVEVCREFRRGFCNRSINECRFAHPHDGVNINEDGSVIICMDHEKGRCARDPCRYFHRPDHMKTTNSSPSKSTSAGVMNGSGNGSVVMNQPIYQHPANLAAASGLPDSVASRTAAAAAAANPAGALNASLLV